MTLLLWLTSSVALAYMLPRANHDWQDSETYCDLDEAGVCGPVSGVSNDTAANATSLGSLARFGRVDTLTYAPSATPISGYGSDAVTLSHGSEQLAAQPGPILIHVYTHADFDSALGISVDTDWYTLTPDAGLCVEICLAERPISVGHSVGADWTTTLYDSAINSIDTITGPGCVYYLTDGAPIFIEVADPSPELLLNGPQAFGFAHQYYRLYLDNSHGNAGNLWYADADGDGFGLNTDGGVFACAAPGELFSVDNTDCDDANTATNPLAFEVCDGADNDCDGQTDEGLMFSDWFPDVDGDGWGDDSASASPFCAEPASGWAATPYDCDDSTADIHPEIVDTCDGVDQDCDGVADEDVPWLPYYIDGDGDGVGGGSSLTWACASPGTGYALSAGDCDDSNPAVTPGSPELCDGLDNDCVGGVDDGLPLSPFYPDLDRDGYGDSSGVPRDLCGPAPGWSASGDDCDDANPLVSPSASELCNGVDDDCVNGVDDGLALSSYYPDADGDGEGDANAVSSDFCAPPSGAWAASANDCDDANPAISPAVSEICNELDDDCDGIVDQGLPTLPWFIDADGDGLGDDSSELQACANPGAGYVAVGGDCDDTLPDAIQLSSYWHDIDGDGAGDPSDSTESCGSPGTGWVSNDQDCDDTNVEIGPAMQDVCDDGVDNDCSGAADEDCLDLSDAANLPYAAACGCSSAAPTAGPWLLLFALVGLRRRTRYHGGAA